MKCVEKNFNSGKYYLTNSLGAKPNSSLNHEANISEISYSVGFGSPSYFAHCFKEEFGHAPSELAK